jgi:VCBS repeat protein/repeat uncharacterized protein DUF346
MSFSFTRRARTSLLVFLLLVSAALAGLGRPAGAAPPPTPSCTWGSPTASGSFTQPFAGVAVGDLFGDGKQRIVAAFPDGGVRVFDSDCKELLQGWPQYPGGAIHGSPTLASLSGDGRLQIIVATECNSPCSPASGKVVVYNPDGSVFPGWPRFSQGSRFGFPEGWFASVAVADLFGDGGLELVAGSWDHYLYAWYSNGNLLPGFPINLYDTIWASPLLVDLNGDGQLDIVQGSDSSGPPTEPYPAGGVYWAFSPGGAQIPGWPKTTNQVAWASPAAAKLDGGGEIDVVAGSGHYFQSPSTLGKEVNVWRQDGSVKPGWPRPTGGWNFGSPAVGDLFGDGRREVVEASEDGKVYAWDASGNSLSGWPVNPNNGQLLSSVTIAPVDGSGFNGVWVPAGQDLLGYTRSGSVAFSASLSHLTVAAPTVVNLGGGQLSVIAIAQTNASNNAWNLYVFPIPGATSMPAGAWPTFHGNYQRTGSNIPVVPPQPGKGGPDATSWGPGRIDTFVRGPDDSLRHKWYNGGWSGWESLGGALTADPGSVSWGSGRLDVFGRGTDNQLWHRYYAGGWSGWEALGGVLSSGPGIATWAPGRLDVFVKGSDNQLWHRWYDNGWAGWEPLGGVLTSDPVAVSWAPGRLDVFAKGSDNQLWHKWYAGGWSGWEPLGGALTSSPAATQWGPGRLDVFARGTDNQMWHKWYAGGWSGWEPLGGVLASDPAASSWSPGRIDLFTRGTNNQMYHKWYSSGWSGWEPLGIF